MRMDTGAITRKRWTAAEVRALPEDRNRYEAIDGELLVTPAPSRPHQRLAAELFFRLKQYLHAEPVAEVLFSPADIQLADNTVVQPDLFAVPLATRERLGQWEDITKLLLAVEILSPATARRDRTTKRTLYQREGVPEYWIVDGDARLIERWRPGDERPEIIGDELVWHPDPTHAPLVIHLPELFTAALGE